MPEAAAEIEPAEHDDLSGLQWEYPPKSDGLKQMVQYIYIITKSFQTHYQMFL